MRVCQYKQGFIPLINVSIQPGFLTGAEQGAGPGCCPPSHELCMWARLKAGITRTGVVGGRPKVGGAIPEETPVPWTCRPRPQFTAS